ncbi:uncharacterized protein LOC133523236 [Cydia pomonella]|uniref:uncharacterized protein LOC133523236 n=1 Tax=Cydia pomonella TaxID=82600 RepID=UPI002ADDABDD|nr:uncharacterized protein LOC133523236 [Cydia pomonella]
MLLLILSISVHLASARFLVSYPVLKVMYGNIGVLDDLKVPPPSRRADMEDDITYGGHEEMPDFHDFLYEIEDLQHWNSILNSTRTTHDLDIKDLDDASKMLTNIKENLQEAAKKQFETRRQNEELKLPHEVDQMWKDPVKLREWYYMKLCLTYLIHIRFQVDTAIRQKMATNAYPSYRIGYLFNRLMKIKTQMYRLLGEWDTLTNQKLTQNRPNWRTKKHNLLMLLQMYERMLQLDVDAKDTVEMVKIQFHGREQYQTEYDVPNTKPLYK